MKMRIKLLWICSLIFVVSACSTEPVPGPDKQYGEGMMGAVSGAGAGAVTGFQLSSATGPGAAVGAGLGAIAGGISGALKDAEEEDLLATAAHLKHEREIAVAHELLQDHYRRRMELHPSRDIFPAEYFFDSDGVTLKCSAKPLVRELVALNKRRFPWSRLVIATYVKANDPKSEYAQHLAERRARELGDQFVKAGIEPRRIETRAVVMSEPLVLDPLDIPDRYSQAVELIPVDM